MNSVQFVTAVSRSLARLGGLLILVCAFLISLDVVFRNVFKLAIFESYELTGYGIAMATAFGLSWALVTKAQSTGIPVSTDNLQRTVHNPTQTKLSAKQRWENVAGIFSVKNPSEFENRHLLLVDDIITTGSTLEACAHAIEHCSNVKVSIAVIGMAD